MEFVSCKLIQLAFVLSFLLLFSRVSLVKSKTPLDIKAVNLGGWLVVEEWMKPSLFDGIPNGDMRDGAQVWFKSVMLNKYVCAEGGGGQDVRVNRDTPNSYEKFRLWRVSESVFHIRTFDGGQFLSSNSNMNNRGLVSATAQAQSLKETETFVIERQSFDSKVTRVHIKLMSTGQYLQAASPNELTANYEGTPGWDDNNAATFEMTIVYKGLGGEYQLANGYGPEKAKEVLKDHWENFVTEADFQFLSSQTQINTVRIPIGWWAAFDNNPRPPYVGGSLEYLDKALQWATTYNIKCIIDLHAAPGSQNGLEHGGSRDGTMNWHNHIEKTYQVIDIIASRYANHPAVIGIELLNEPKDVSPDILVSYYKNGYKILRRYSQQVYVIICQTIDGADPMKLVQANIGASNLVLDVHYYNVFDASLEKKSAAENIDNIRKNRLAEIQKLDAASDALVFVGEWANVMYPTVTDSPEDYQNYGRAQLEVYGKASFGWAYWTLHNEQNRWDLQYNIKNNLLQLGK